MTTKELLTNCTENTGHALTLLEQLAQSASASDGLPVKEVRPQLEEINRRLREAQSAAQSLANLAAGNPPPKLG